MSVSLIDGHVDEDAPEMTDEQIIKALECCSDYFDCDNCECKEYCPKNFEELFALALDLINRQKAEIERHREHIELLDIEHEAIKISAIKEFVERLTDKADLKAINAFESSWVISQEQIDNLVKEMAGEG